MGLIKALDIPVPVAAPTPSVAPILASLGSIQEVAKAAHVTGELLTAHHGTDPDVIFEYRVTAGSVGAGHIKVDVTGATDAASVAAILIPLLNANLLRQTATAGAAGLVNMAGKLADDLPYTFTETVTDSGFVATDMTPPTGNKTWTYKLVAVKANGLKSAAGSAGTTTAGGAALSTANLNRLTWTDPTVAFDHLEVWRTVCGAASTPSTTGLLATVAAGVQAFDDHGQAGDSATAPSVDHSGEGDVCGVTNLSDVVVQVNTFTAGSLQVQGTVDGTNFVNDGSALTATGVVAASHKWAGIRVKTASLTGAAPSAVVLGRQDPI